MTTVEGMSTKSKTIKCYHCGGKVENETTDLVLKKIPLHTKKGVRMYTRKFHVWCVSDFVDSLETEKETQAENKDWEKCYEYAKELLGIPEGKNLDSHFILRLLGLRAGTYVPNGSNVRGIKRGYDFETILTAMKFSSVAIRHAFGTMQFKDQKHKIDYAMKIITNNINFVYGKLENKKKADSKLTIEPVEDVVLPEYTKKGKQENSSEKISSLISSKISNDEEMDELLSLFE